VKLRTVVASVVACVLTFGIGLVAPVVTAAPAEAVSKISARTLLNQLPVRSETNKGYSRSKFAH
jgi:hypothetical protein